MVDVAPPQGRTESSSQWSHMSRVKGDALLRTKDYNAALTHYTRAIALAPATDLDSMVSLLCRRAIALLHFRVSC